ncbi:MAG TPA: hypothetical protein ENN61_05490, partial [Bacteroidaceae bacterium]|nr:hypothetical protein [Bacteroidaceae bacterium]
KEAIGRHNLSPSLDFSKEGIIDIPVLRKDSAIKNPEIDINPEYNPFQGEEVYKRRKTEGWEKFYQKYTNENLQPDLNFDGEESDNGSSGTRYLQILNTYIVTSVKSGFMIIDQRRANERITYENIIRTLQKNTRITQQSLFPMTVELSPSDYQVFEEISSHIEKLGFDIRSFGKNSIIIHGAPAFMSSYNFKDTIENMLEQYKNLQSDINIDELTRLARSASSASAIPYGKKLNEQEMRELVDKLFGCDNPYYSPSGEIIVKIITREGIENIFKEVVL